MLSLRSLALLAFTCLLAFVASPRVVAGQDVVYTTYQTMAARLRSQPFDPAVRDQIVDSMKKAMSLYTFLNINRDSTQGAPTDISVWGIKSDILADIQAVAEATYSSAIEMDEAFANIFMKVNDAHTSYRKNYAAFGFGLPFRMSSQAAVDAKNNVFTQVSIFSTKTSFKLYETVYGYSPLVNATVSTTGAPATLDDIENYVIVSIQGQPAVKYLWSLANQQGNFEVGTSKDPHTRYNLLTHGFTVDPNGAPGWFGYRSMARFGIPAASEEIVTLEVRNPDSPTDPTYLIPFQWIGIGPKPGQMDFNELHFPKPTPKQDTILEQQQIEEFYYSIHSLQHPALYKQLAAVHGTTPKQPALKEPVKIDSAAILEAKAAGQSDYSIPGEISFTVLPDNTGVLQIQTFAPNDNAAFLTLIQTAITNHQLNLNGKKLLIDLRANGGGDICLGYAVIRFLFPQVTKPDFGPHAVNGPAGRYDMTISPLTQRMADLGAASMKEQPSGNDCDFFTPCGWVNPNTDLQYVDETWFNSGRTALRGGVTEQFTALFHDSCYAEYFSRLTPADINPGYEPKNVVLISDGMCGSTCSVFSSFISYNHLAKTIVFGGVLGIDGVDSTISQQFWSFPGGQVAQVAYLQQIARGYGIPTNDSMVPQLYPNQASQSFTFREIYQWNDPVGVYPLEFVRHPSDFQLSYSGPFTDTNIIYDTVINGMGMGFFGDAICVTGVTNTSCAVEHGIGYRMCAYGILQPGCLVQDCDAGYENHNNVCQPCEAGFYRDKTSFNHLCIACPENTAVVEKDGVECSSTFTATGMTSPSCPYVVTCKSTGSGGSGDSDDGKVSKSALIGVAASLSALILILIIVIIRQRKAQVRTSLDDGFLRM